MSTTDAITRDTPLAIQLTDIVKRFGAVTANAGASLEVARGEIHAICGENGAGKSTLMRILAGGMRPDGGRVEVDGRDVTGWSTADAIRAGVGMVYQHFQLVPTLTVVENLVLGDEPVARGQLELSDARQAIRALCERTGLVIDPDRLVGDLSVGEAQRVEILKTLFRGARTLVLDEPTAVLSPPEVTDLWRVLRRLRDDGGTIVLITHKLDEVLEAASVVTVMRAGRTVGRLSTAGATPADIARAMVGRDVALAARDPKANAAVSGAPALQVAGLTVRNAAGRTVVDNLSFSVRPGEILGIAGVEGNGQTELVAAIAGLVTPSAGRVLLEGRDVTRWRVAERTAAGLAHIPEDRHARGLVLDWSIADNLVLGQQHRFTQGGRLDVVRVAAHAEAQIAAFDIRPGNALLPARALSGGNQQKIVIARELGGGRDVRVLLAAQPTRGVDVGAIEAIHARLRAARDAGAAVLLVSADLGELLALSTRVAVMYGGALVFETSGADATPELLGPHMTGAAA
ncbi:MAG: ABC transporter ATP-binding protein [Gemmatimonadaceae bacterium]|nr:ABC transporter ATP-binding protein [Gemmatimonadaceae bacterium]